MLPFILIAVLAAALAPATALAQGPIGYGWPPIQAFLPPLPQSTVIYDSTVTPLPGNLASHAFQGTGTSEFGDEITFDGDSRALQQVTVTMSSWACETGHWGTNPRHDDCVTTPGATFSMPITLTIYNVGDNDTVGDQIATLTQTFDIPYRPSADDTNCTGDDASKWYNSSDNSCNNGLATNITFDFSSQAVTLPDSVIYGISFNTSSYGTQPYGTETDCFTTDAGCFYDSLNVAVSPEVVVGSQVHPGKAFMNANKGSHYCDAGEGGTFRLDSPTCSPTDGFPAVQFTAGQPPATGPFAWLYNFLRQLRAHFGDYFGGLNR